MLAAPTPLVRRMARECIAVRMRLLHRQVSGACDEGLRPHGVHVAQVNLLVAIASAGPVKPTDLAAHLVLDKSTLSRDMRFLLKRGWVERAVGNDRRSHRLQATEAGVAFLETIGPIWQSTQKQLAAQLGPEFVAALHGTVNAVWADLA